MSGWNFWEMRCWNCLTSEFLLENFPEWTEGQLSKSRARIVNAHSLENAARNLDLGAHLRLGRGEEKTGGRDKPALLADAFEAVVAAMYLDGGLDPARVLLTKTVLLQARENGDRMAESDRKSALQEFLQGKGGQLAEYRLAGESGPDHQKTFLVEVWVHGRVHVQRRRKHEEGSGAESGPKRAGEAVQAEIKTRKRLDRMPDETLAPGSGTSPEPQNRKPVAEAADEGHTHAGQTTFSEYLESLLVTVILALFGTTFVVQAFKIPSQSMERTLLVGDHLLVNKFIFGGRGRLVRLCSPVPRSSSRRHHRLQVSLSGPPALCEARDRFAGRPLKDRGPAGVRERQAHWTSRMWCTIRLRPTIRSTTLSRPSATRVLVGQHAAGMGATNSAATFRTTRLVVPAGKYFAMGDNRDHSLDSRYWGFVDRDAIMGRPFLIYWSIDANSTDYGDNTFGQRLYGIFDTLMHLPARTRWSRMLHTVH